MKFSTERPYLWLFAILALVGFVADQASKYVVFAKLYPGEREQVTLVDVVPDAFALRTFYSPEKDPGDERLSFLRTLSGERLPHVNKGALFGFGNTREEAENGGFLSTIVGFIRNVLSIFEDAEGGLNTLFAGISVVAACFIVFWVARPMVAQDRYLCFALGLILAGTLGNLYDRIVFAGVRDFLHWYYRFIWPDFNVADCCLVCGAGVLLVHSFFVKDPAAEPAKIEAAGPMQTTSPTTGA